MSAGQRGLDPATPLAPTATGMILLQELRSGSIVAERFRIERILGLGGMGLVYLAHDLELDVDVALKQLRPELAARADAFERFRKELLLARSVSSPHVVRIHDLVRHEQTWLISMDYVPGRSLERLLQEERLLDPERALGITRQLALGLAAAHASGVVHRDLKPANILIDHTDLARITDFGVARAAGDTGITGSGVVIGTPEYLSPEQARAEPLDGRSDLYALGLILFEMLTGTLPFRGGTPAEMMIQRVVQAPPRADTIKPDLPAFAVELCARLLALDRDDRLEDADHLVRTIDRGQLVPLPAVRATARLPRWPWVAALLVSLSLWLIQRSPVEPPVAAPIENKQVSQLDVLPLPWSVKSVRSEDQILADAIWFLLAEQLSLGRGLNAANPARVRRTLRELGFDGAAADRQHDRVLQVSGAQLVLEGDWIRTASGVTLKLRLVSRVDVEPRWQWQRSDLASADLPAVLQELGSALTDALPDATGRPSSLRLRPWPSVAQLEVLGAWSQQSLGNLAKASAASIEALDPAATWLWLSALDRTGQNAQAATAARSVLDQQQAAATDLSMARLRGFAWLLVGDPEQAETDLRELVALAPGDHPSRRMLARSLAEQGRFDEAIQILEQLLAEDPGNGDAWYEAARYALQSGDSKRAVDELLVRAQVLANRLNDAWLRADVANALGIGYRRLGQLDAAADELDRAIQLRARLSDPRGQAASLGNLSLVRSIQGDFEAARGALQQARTLIEPLGDSDALADLATDMGLLAEEEGDYQTALASYREGLSLRQTQGDPRSMAESLLNVGFAYFHLGEFDNAQTYWAQARSLYGELDDKIGLVHTQESLGLAGIARGNWTEARAELEAGLLTAESLQMDEEMSNALAILADLDRLEGRYGSALQRVDAALASFERRGDLRGSSEMHLLRAQIMVDLGLLEEATNALQPLLQAPPESAEQQGLLKLRLAELALASGSPSEALQLAADLLDTPQQSRVLALAMQARLLGATAHAALGDQRSASADLQFVHDDLSRYASVALRLLLAEAQLQIGGSQTPQIWRSTEALLARLPQYGRAWRLYALASRADALDPSGTWAERHLSSRQQLLDALPEALRARVEAAGGPTGIGEATHD